jgi:hypothetical protein
VTGGPRGASSEGSPRACSCGSRPCCPRVSGGPRRRPRPPCTGSGGPPFSRSASATWLVAASESSIRPETLAVVLCIYLYMYICLSMSIRVCVYQNGMEQEKP